MEAMNRLGKALMELGDYEAARKVFDRVVSIAPYNNIAKKNAARLAQLEASPAAVKQVRKSGAAPQLFIEESGKSGTNVAAEAGGASSSRPAHSQRPGQPGHGAKLRQRVQQRRGVPGAD